MELDTPRRPVLHSLCCLFFWQALIFQYLCVGRVDAVSVFQLPQSSHFVPPAVFDRSVYLPTHAQAGKNSIVLCHQVVPKSCSNNRKRDKTSNLHYAAVVHPRSQYAFLSPLGMFRFLRKREFTGEDVGGPEVSGSTACLASRVEDAIESAVAAASAEAVKRLDMLRRDLQRWFMEEVIKRQQSDLEGHDDRRELPSSRKEAWVLNSLPVTARTAQAAEEAVSSVFARNIAVARSLGATDAQISAAKTRVVELVDREIKSLYQLQMQQHILRLLYQFLRRLREEGQFPQSTPGGSKVEDSFSWENAASAAAAVVVKEFGELMSASASTDDLRKKWGCMELEQLLQQQLEAHKQQQQQQHRQVGNERKQQQQQVQALIRVVQQQQSLLQQVQQQLQQEQQPRPFAMGAAYRVPDTNLQISAASRQGRLQLNVTCVPDDSPAAAAGVLGQQGFVRGIEAFGNLGLSCSFSV